MNTTSKIGYRLLGVTAICAVLLTGCSESRAAPTSADAGRDGVGNPSNALAPTQEQLAALMHTENLRRVRSAGETLARESEGASDTALASSIHTIFAKEYSKFLNDVNVACRSSICQVRFSLKASSDEKTTVNSIASDRARWAGGFKTVDYVPVNTIDGEGRFLLWREMQVVNDAGTVALSEARR